MSRLLIAVALSIMAAACTAPAGAAAPAAPTATAPPTTTVAATPTPAPRATASAGAARDTAALTPFVGDWSRHSTLLYVGADGRGTLNGRTYAPCGTADDCAYASTFRAAGGTGGAIRLTFDTMAYVSYDEAQAPMTPTAAQYRELDRYYPRPGDQVDARIDPQGRLLFTPIGRFGKLADPDGAWTYCNPDTDSDARVDCGA